MSGVTAPIFANTTKYLGAFIGCFGFVVLSVWASGFPVLNRSGSPVIYSLEDNWLLSCTVISLFVMFITITCFDDLNMRGFWGLSAINGFTYHSTIVKFLDTGAQNQHETAILLQISSYYTENISNNVNTFESFITKYIFTDVNLTLTISAAILVVLNAAAIIVRQWLRQRAINKKISYNSQMLSGIESVDQDTAIYRRYVEHVDRISKILSEMENHDYDKKADNNSIGQLYRISEILSRIENPNQNEEFDKIFFKAYKNNELRKVIGMQLNELKTKQKR